MFIIYVTITCNISAESHTCLPPWDDSKNTVEIRCSSVAFFQTNTDTDNNEPHQLRSAATHVLQLRTFSPASTAGTTTRDEMIGILCGCPRLRSTKMCFFLSSLCFCESFFNQYNTILIQNKSYNFNN